MRRPEPCRARQVLLSSTHMVACANQRPAGVLALLGCGTRLQTFKLTPSGINVLSLMSWADRCDSSHDTRLHLGANTWDGLESMTRRSLGAPGCSQATLQSHDQAIAFLRPTHSHRCHPGALERGQAPSAALGKSAAQVTSSNIEHLLCLRS